MNAIRSIGSARHNAMQKDDLGSILGHGNIRVVDTLELIGKSGELMIVSGEERAGSDVIVDVLDHSAGYSQAIVCAGASAHFVEHEEAAGSGVIENVCRLDHFHHESRL